MPEEAPKFNTVEDADARKLNPNEIADAQAGVAAMTEVREPQIPESHQETIEAIQHEETRLQSNLEAQPAIIETAEKKLASSSENDPVAQLRQRTNLLQAKETWDKAQERFKSLREKINNWSLGTAMIVGPGALAGGVLAGAYAEQLKVSAMDSLSSVPDIVFWENAAQTIVESGFSVAVASAAVWAIARGINAWRKKSAENAYYKARTQAA